MVDCNKRGLTSLQNYVGGGTPHQRIRRSCDTTATSTELTDAKDRKSAYQKAVPLAPGTYKVDVIVRDVASGATGIRHLGFTVPKYEDKKLSTSTLILAAKLKKLE